MPKRTCACCGHRTLPPGDAPTWLDCPVCWWTDVPPGANQPGAHDLIHAQLSFSEIGVCSDHLIKLARPASENEPRDPAWTPLIVQHDREKEELLAWIRRSFDGVELGAGVSLDEAESMSFMRDVDQPRRHEAWTDVTDAEIEADGHMMFLDAPGFRFYVPAFMIHFMRASPSPQADGSQDFMFMLSLGRTFRFESFSDDQLDCVGAFLDFVERYHPWCFGDDVRKARKGGL